MSTKITKWTREKKSDKKTDFRDKTRQSHADLPFGISSEENWRIHTLASKLEKLPNEPQKESSLAASVAVGSSQNANDAAIQKRIHKLRQEKDAYKSQPSSTDQKLCRRSDEDILKDPFSKNRPERLEDKLRKKENIYQHLLLDNCQICELSQKEHSKKENLELATLPKAYLENLKNKINQNPLRRRQIYDDVTEINKIRQQQIDAKIQTKKEATREKRSMAEKMLKLDLKIKQEAEERKEQKRSKQNELRMQLDNLCKFKTDLQLREREMIDKELRGIEKSNKMYERQKYDDMIKKQEMKHQLLMKAKQDIEARKRFLNDLKEREKKEEEQNFEYSIFKRAFGRKMRQYTKDKVCGRKPQV